MLKISDSDPLTGTASNVAIEPAVIFTWNYSYKNRYKSVLFRFYPDLGVLKACIRIQNKSEHLISGCIYVDLDF